MARSLTPARTALRLSGIAFAAVILAGCSAAGTGTDAGSGGGSTAASGDSTADLAAAQAVVDAALAPPTTITQTEPLPAAPEPGVIVDVNNGLPGSIRIGAGVKAAAEAAGWEFTQITYDAAAPASLQGALMNALTKNPTVVTESGSPQSEFGDSVLKAYEDAGVALIPASTEPIEKVGPIIVDSSESPNGYAYNKAMATILANWFVVDSGGAGHAIVATVPTFPSLKGVPDGFVPEVEKLCPECTVDVIEISLSDVQAGTSQDTVVSALRRSADTKYVFFDNGAFASGIDSKLAAAGLSDVIVGGIAPEPADVEALKAGGKSAWMTVGFEYTGYGVMDLAYRHQQNVDLTTNNAVQPTQLMTAENAVSGPWNLPADGLEQFQTLWQVGK